MKNLRNSKTSGISLVALIVTIIVLIILTAAVIVTFMEGGIIEKAKEAVFKSDIRTYQEILAVKNAENMINLSTGNGEGTQLNSTEVKDIIPEFKEEYAGMIVISNGKIVLGSISKAPYATWLADLGIGAGETSDIELLEVGDYVKYSIPEGERKAYNITEKLGDDATNWIYNDLDNGTDAMNFKLDFDEGENIIEYNEGIKWRVLKNNGSTVTLVSEDPVDNICLYGEEGFTQGPGVLDTICAEVYGGRNLKVEDVVDVLRYETITYYWNSASTPVAKELGYTFGDAIAEEEYDVNNFSYLPDNYEDLELYYEYDIEDVCTNASDLAKELIIRDKEYWLSSSCASVNFGNGNVEFIVSEVGVGWVAPIYLYDLDGEEEFWVCGLRPVVTLSSSIQVVDEDAGGKTPDKAWELK